MPLIRARRSPYSFLGDDFGNVLSPALRQAPSFYDSSTGPTPTHDNDYSHFPAIQILPTADEVLASDKPVYMPKRDLAEANPIPPGVDRLLDLVFRQLRYENIEKIRDIAYSAAQAAFLRSTVRVLTSSVSALAFAQESNGHLEPGHETPTGNRYFLYRNVQVEELLPQEQKSVVVRLSFNCPPFMRGKNIHHAGRFENGMLVALLCLDTTSNELEIYYLQVYMLQSTYSMTGRGGQGRKAAVQVNFLPGTSRNIVKQFARFAQKLDSHVEMCLVEFPKVLHAGFYNCLSRLQKLHGFAFSSLIAPSLTPERISDHIRHRLTHGNAPYQHCEPPRYAEETEFEYNFQPLTKEDIPKSQASFTLSELDVVSSIPMIQSFTSLDQGQAAAVRHSLLSRLAFTQGPPGTGKSYTGIALARILLASRPTASKKPILVVCVTNHALDSFLEGLKEAGVENLLRIGGGSREEWTAAINLREKRRKSRFTANEAKERSPIKMETNERYVDIDSWCTGQSTSELIGEVNWFAINDVLFHYHRNIWDQFKCAASSPLMIPLLFDFWASGGDFVNMANLRNAMVDRLAKKQDPGVVDVTGDFGGILAEMTSAVGQLDTDLGDKSIWKFSTQSRRALINDWASMVDASTLADDLARLYHDHQSLREKLQETQTARDIRIMQQADIIGMTTTACAGKWELLNALGIEIIVCEEAGEVLEPHVICTLLPSVQHAIFIGDPKQLRPQVSEYVLSTDCTPEYRLDESLFEKMIFPRDHALCALPMAQLNIQRRMHPSISAISRITYPFLQDHASTFSHDSTIGLVDRIFWWDHRVPELKVTGVTKSHINQYEIDMVTGLVQYLLKNSGYSQGDIAVITPYSGQLARLHECLRLTCRIWLNDRDRELLLSEEILEDEEKIREKEEVAMSDMLRIATIDNFQGEEAKVVILTTVRSGGHPGFLSIYNRINVACSRARNGFYIVGNSETLGQVDMWNSIINLLGNRLGFELITQCNNHPTHRYRVRYPRDFGHISECAIPCDQLLACGHPCPEKCHPLELHADNIIPCNQRCQRVLPCGHQCTKPCGVDCGSCHHIDWDQPLPCGHSGHMLCSGKLSKCKVSLGVKTLSCGHAAEVFCSDSPEPVCNLPCLTQLGCGHRCSRICTRCQEIGHSTCINACSMLLKCAHLCQADCGHDGDCPPCEQSVQVSCEHGVRTRLCSQRAELCLKPQSDPPAPADDFKTPCCLPSVRLPPSRLCSTMLSCGHACSSLASETCIPAGMCQVCRTGDSSKIRIFIAECGHIVDLDSLDNVNIQGIYTVDQHGTVSGFGTGKRVDIQPARCVCGTICPSVRRYRQISKLASLPETLNTFVAKVYVQMEAFSFGVDELKRQLALTYELLKGEVRTGPLAANSNRRLLLIRKDLSKDIVDNIQSYRAGVIDIFESHLGMLTASCDGIPSYNLIAGLHFQTLETRCLIVALLDQIMVAEMLLAVEDPSSITRNTGIELLRAAAAEAISTYRAKANVIATEKNLESSPALQVETRIHEIMLWLIADYALCVSQTISSSHASTSYVLPSFSASLDVVMHISTHNTAAKMAGFLETAQGIRRILGNIRAGEKIMGLPVMDLSGLRKAEKLYREYSRAAGGSSLVLCGKGHPYFKAVFGSCPVCGKSVVSNDEEFLAAGKFLQEEAFLAKMRAMRAG